MPTPLRPALLVALSLLAALPLRAEPYFWNGFAGQTRDTGVGLLYGTGSGVPMVATSGVAVDASGNVYVSNTSAHTVLKIAGDASFTRFAGTDGQSGNTDNPSFPQFGTLSSPRGLAFDTGGNLYIADTGNNRIRKVTPAGALSTFKTGLTGVRWIACDSAGAVFVTGNFNDAHVKKIDGAGMVTNILDVPTLGGLFQQQGVAVDTSNNDLYIVTNGNTVVKRTAAGVFSVVVGGATGYVDDTGAAAQFDGIQGIAVDSVTHTLYVTEQGNRTVRKITSGGVVTTIGGAPATTGFADGTGANAGFATPLGIARGKYGELFVADTEASSSLSRVTRGVDVTASPIALSAPVEGGIVGANFTISFTLPAAALADGSMNLYFDDGGGRVRRYRLDYRSATKLTTAGAHSFTFNALAPLNSSPAGSIDSLQHTGGSQGELTSGNYTVTLGYFDAVTSAPVFTQPTRDVTIDMDGPVFAETDTYRYVEATKPGGADVAFLTGVSDAGSGVNQSTVSFKVNNVAVTSPLTCPLSSFGSTTDIVFSATDNLGNTSTKTLKIEVGDATAPTADAPALFELTANDYGYSPVGDLTGSLTNIVEAVTPIADLTRYQQPAANATLTLGTHPLKLYIVDARGNTREIASTVKVAYPTLTTPALHASVLAGPVTKSGALGAVVSNAAQIGLSSTASYTAFFTPAISDSRSMAARAMVQDGTKKLGAIYLSYGDGTGSVFALEGAKADPNTVGSTAVWKSFGDPLLTPKGYLTFFAKVADAALPKTEDEGLWSNVHGYGAFIQVLQEGHEVGLGANILLKTITSVSTRDGEIVAMVKLAGTGVAKGTDQAILRQTFDANTSAVATSSLLRTGDVVDGKKVLAITAFQPGIASPGQGRTHADGGIVVRAKTDIAGDLIIAVEDDGTPHLRLSTVGITTLVAGPVTKIGLPGTAGAGTSVRATVKFPAPGKTVDALFYAAVAGDFTSFLKVGDPINAGTGTVPTFIAFADPAVGDAPWVAFRGTFTGKAPATTGLFQWTGTTPRTVALGGSPAPDADGNPIAETAFKTFLNYAQPDGPTARPVFIAEVTGKAVTGATKLGLWAETGGKSLRLLLRNGQDVTVSPGVVKKLASFRLLDALPSSFGSRRSYNASSSVAVLATFTDKSQALLRLDIP